MADVKDKKSPAETPETLRAAAASDGGAPSLDINAMISEAKLSASDVPAMSPPGDETAEAVAADGVTAWHNGKKITATWCNSSNRNAFVSVQGMGWRRLSNANDSAFLAMVMMGAHAEQMNATVNLKISSSNEIQEIYVW
ncbi:hypothetical protein [Litorivita sp. NS0012-18]|uniref:hypothetical protein n=1 Tax=Litorivita sp. NS0012-18 TaxID=3127655 RepID=UPI0031063342